MYHRVVRLVVNVRLISYLIYRKCDLKVIVGHAFFSYLFIYLFRKPHKTI